MVGIALYAVYLVQLFFTVTYATTVDGSVASVEANNCFEAAAFRGCSLE